MSNAQVHFDHIADKYKKAADTWKSVYDKAQSLIEPLIKDKIILDVGNGGYFFYDTHLPSKVICLDISPEMLARIKEPHIEKRVGDARNLDGIGDNSMDVILYALAIHHINGSSVKKSLRVLDEVLKAAHRKLKKGGQLIIVEPTLLTPLYLIEFLAFPLTQALLSSRNVSMIFFYKPDILRNKIAEVFHAPVQMTPLPATGMIDPLGGSFPGLLKIPASFSPTQYFLFQTIK